MRLMTISTFQFTTMTKFAIWLNADRQKYAPKALSNLSEIDRRRKVTKPSKSGGAACTPTPRSVFSQIRPAPRRGLSRIESAMYIGVSPSKFDELRKDGRIGPPRLIDGRKVWDIGSLNRDFEAFPSEGTETAEDWDTSL
jgi:hypothetical protein